MSHGYGNYVNNYHKNAEAEENMKYKRKYRKLNRIVKNLVFENVALCDQVAQMQDNLVVVKEERLFLLRKLCQIHGEQDPATVSPKTQCNINNSSSTVPSADGSTTKKNIKKRSASDVATSGETNNKVKSKRSGKTAKKLVQLIPLDVHGRPLFPISLGDLTIYSLGEVVADRTSYHTEELIYPVGFCSTRLYASLKDPYTKSLYTCKILDGGQKPRFEIVSDSDLDQPLVGTSPDECHLRLLTAISPLLCNIPPKGAQFFGVSHPTIQNLIQSSPGTRKLALYKPQRFEVSKSQSTENGTSTMPDEEIDPGISFATLHKIFSFTSTYNIKEEPIDDDL